MNTSGIYCIENLVNGKKYIGATLNFKNRFRRHRSDLRRNIHQNEHLQSAWNKYGEKNFEFSIILKCEKSKLDKNEIELIRKNKCNDRRFGYNLDGGGVANNRVVSDETRRKMSLVRKANGSWIGENNPCYGKPFVGNKHPMRGKHHSKISSDKISRSLAEIYKDKTKTTMYGKHHTEETKNKIRKSREKYTGKNHPWYGKKHSKHSIEKMRGSHRGKVASEETRKKMSLSHSGQKFTEEHKKHLSVSLKKSSLKGENHPRYGKKISEETREKMRVGRKLAWLHQKGETKSV